MLYDGAILGHARRLPEVSPLADRIDHEVFREAPSRRPSRWSSTLAGMARGCTTVSGRALARLQPLGSPPSDGASVQVGWSLKGMLWTERRSVVTLAVTTESAARRRPKDRKQQIIRQARDLFVEHGFPNVAMAQIAEKVDITAGALYRHFANKQVLLDEVVKESFAYLDQQVSDESLAAALDDALGQFISHPYSAELWSNEARHLTQDVQDDLRLRMRRWTHGFLPLLAIERPDLDLGQRELMAWALQSILVHVNGAASPVSATERLPVVKGAAVTLLAPSSSLVGPSGRGGPPC